MSGALRLAGFVLAAALFAFTLRAAHKAAGAAVALAAGVMLFFFAATQLAPAVEALQSLAQRAGIGADTSALLLKLTGMAYVTEFAVQACRDAGEEGLAEKAALCGKMLLFSQTLPLIVEIGELTLSLTP